MLLLSRRSRFTNVQNSNRPSRVPSSSSLNHTDVVDFASSTADAGNVASTTADVGDSAPATADAGDSSYLFLIALVVFVEPSSDFASTTADAGEVADAGDSSPATADAGQSISENRTCIEHDNPIVTEKRTCTEPAILLNIMFRNQTCVFITPYLEDGGKLNQVSLLLTTTGCSKDKN